MLRFLFFTVFIVSSAIPAFGLEELSESEENIVQEFYQTVEWLSLRRDSVYELNGVEMNDRCETFITRRGGLGPLGEYVINQLTSRSNDYAPLLSESWTGERSLPGLCPVFRSLSDRHKAILWALIVTSMAQKESSCDVEAENHNAPNGVAAGFFGMHQSEEGRYPSIIPGACYDGVSGHAQDSVLCLLGMLGHQVQNNDGNVFFRGAHFEVLRPRFQSAQAIQRAVESSSLCQTNAI